MEPTSLKRWLIILAISFLSLPLQAFLTNSFLGDQLDNMILDSWFTLQGPLAPPDEVVVVAMDELSYSALGVSKHEAWPRTLHTRLLKQLQHYGARRVGFDIMFEDPADNPEHDQQFATALQLLPTIIGMESNIREFDTPSGSHDLEEIIEPYEPFAKAAKMVALVGVPESEGVVRHFSRQHTPQTINIPTLSQALAEISTSDKFPQERDYIRYYGPARTVETVSYHMVLEQENELLHKLFQNKLVLVGLSLRTALGPADKDSFRSPYSLYSGERIFGVEIHATMAANLLRSDWIRRATKRNEDLILGGLTFLGMIFLLSSAPSTGGIFLLFTIGGWCVLAFNLFVRGLFVPGVTVITVIYPIGYIISVLIHYFTTRRAKAFIEKAFSHYLSPAMARQVAEQEGSLKLGGRAVEATALFTDIAGFTSISEEMDSEQVSEMLNEYFSAILDVAFDNHGTLIKFTGDGVFFLWGAPIEIKHHAELAVQAALLLQQGVTRFNSSNKYPALFTRIGIHTGKMFVGNFGTKKRFDYTAIGDAVNLASRIEGLNKMFGSNILISEQCHQQLAGRYRSLMMGRARVVGKREPVRLYMLTDNNLSDEASEAWLNGLQAWNEQSWELALVYLSEAASYDPILNIALTTYKSFLNQYRLSGPPPGWKGELVFESK